MNMTSKGTLLVAVAGVIGLGCSSPAEDDSDTMRPPPGGIPPAYATPPAPNPMQTANPLQPAPTNNEAPPPVVQQQPPPATGTGGAGGAGAMPAPGSTIPVGPAGTGFALTPVAGWVAGGTNEAGIQGAFSTISDATGTPPGTTTIMPASFQMATGSQICVSGSVSQVVGTAYAQYWGGGVAFDLGDPGQMMPKVPWNRGRVVGFSFNITGTTIPPMAQFRFGVAPYEGSTIDDDGPCTNITMGANTIMLTQLRSACYDTAAPGPALAGTALLASLKWQVATVTTAPTPFNFCITDLKAITQ
jgi:hypothetical protein